MKAGKTSVSVTLMGATSKGAELEFKIRRKRGKPEAILLLLNGPGMARLLSVLNDPTVLDPDWAPTLMTDPMIAPKVGDMVYVGPSLYIDHGQDDVMGGLAHVTDVRPSMSAGQMVPFVSVLEHRGRFYNWRLLAVEQEKLAKEFRTKWAYEDPES